MTDDQTRTSPAPASEDDEAPTLFDERAAEHIRRVEHQGRWFFSVIDVIGLLTESTYPNRYWSDLKRKLTAEGAAQVYENLVRLKLRSPDGRMRETDCADAETMLRIVQSIPSPKAEPIKQWLARVGTERLAEGEDPGLAVERARKMYARQGYSDEWIERRIQGIAVREELTSEWAERGASESKQIAALTNILHTGTYDVSVAEHQAIKGLRSRQNLRDSMTTLELLLTSLAEETSATLHRARDSQGMPQLSRDAQDAGGVSGDARREIEHLSGQPVVSAENYKTLRQGRQRELQPPLLGDGEGERA